MTNKLNPFTFRPTEEDMDAIDAIQKLEARPGLKITQSDAIRIALADWLGANKSRLEKMTGDIQNQ